MKLSTKIIASFSGLVILVLVIGWTSQYYFNTKIKNKVIEESRGAVTELEVSGDLESYLHQSFLNAQYYLDISDYSKSGTRFQDSLLSKASVKRKVLIALQGLNLNFEKTQTLLEQNNQTTFLSSTNKSKNESIIARLNHGVRLYNSLLHQLLNKKKSQKKQARHLLDVTIEPLYRNTLLPLVKTFRHRVRKNLNKQVALLNKRLNRFSNLLVIATFVAFILALIFAYLLYQSIATPIFELAEAAGEIGRGNFYKKIEIKSDNEIGQLGKAFNKMTENLNKITFSKEYVDDIIDSMRDSLIVTDKELNITKTNEATLHMLGYNKGDLLRFPMAKIIADGNDKSLLSPDEDTYFENRETIFQKKEGDQFPVNLSKAIVYDRLGFVQSLVYVASDITERKRSEKMIKESLEEKKILLSEIHHRVKNNLAVISGLLQMQRWETENMAAKQVLQDSQLRVKSIALVHEKLYQSEDLSNIKFDRYVNELIEGINKTFRSSTTDITFKVEVEPLVLGINQAIPCSLLLNELIVNIHKHAFKNTDKGKVFVSLCNREGTVYLKVKDNGIGLDEAGKDKSTDSLGMALVDTLVKQLSGTLDICNDEGAAFNITFKLKA